ncbi:mannose-1-phosphate guanylyltransferase/mannose-6-phosphate isomerase [Rhizorhabdus dicambivorans]|uniref:mannose-1-phosphate guanylyltransferase n=1 Tax=Rhizorhabdus dicambivorans TaxID=1850238 RepID=A0A2A4FZX7_9SPHN|nr:mannose-1-phosphate guanylyltransferase/mannose-6-phosphate isomerase [Rhizorhabdus dicambivorans]ATE66736.1 mannose-1-phosphate guanylyltransferase/mannose-6-phosphate isomerase [Rhizorhabdus dicambivorans]PCE43776.1 mannose-1-phosphate guanylyltransferase/mannose-6-phosphate isomerase [Rhizorhabdus dicambivorans]
MERPISTTLITPVILSGGSGTRLWPLSRSKKPKQLLALTGERTMLQMTAARCIDRARFGAPIIVTNALHATEIAAQLAEEKPAAIMLEPAGRNTAPAIALAALESAPATPLLVMPSDHVIEDCPAFLAAIEKAMPLVEAGWLVTFGITPDKPETGYGYIRRGESVAPGVHKVDAFIEKPNLARAQAYLAEGSYSWNGGIFLFRADAYLAALERFEPEMLAAVRASLDAAAREGAMVIPAAEAFLSSRSESIDYAVMEKAERVAVVPVDMGWSDVGSWDALHLLGVPDDNANVLQGDVVAIDTRGCMIRSEGPVVTAVGIENLIVVATRDAVMILPRGASQEVKKIVEALKARGHETLDAPF